MTDTCTCETSSDGYEEFSAAIVKRFSEIANGRPLFTTDAKGLWPTYLDNLPPENRQHYNCHACRHFIERFGGLVYIDDHGKSKSAIWRINCVPGFFRNSQAALRKQAERAKITGVFLSSGSTLGIPETGEWGHLHVLQSHPAKRPTIGTLSQKAAEKTQDFRMLRPAVADYDLDVVRSAKALLKAQALYRSEKVLGVATWLEALLLRLKGTQNKLIRRNMIWVAAATAPPGYCHVRSTMIGTLLEDLAAGMDFDSCRRRFDAKMHPLQYQRPIAPLSDGNIAQAEKIVAELGAAGALRRRFALLDDVESVWRPKPESIATAKVSRGVFTHLSQIAKARQPADTGAPTQTMTWAKFAATVLPTAESVSVDVPYHGSFSALVTAADSDAPSILQWDNPVSWYVYMHGSSASRWNLDHCKNWTKVNAITLLPSQWGGQQIDHHGKGIFILVDGCRDVEYKRSGGLFPEQLRSEYHGVRRTMEAYARDAVIEGKEEATACGLIYTSSGKDWGVTLRVVCDGVAMTYTLDRWD